MKKILFISLILLSMIFVSSFISSLAKVTLIVVDESGAPLEGIDVGVGFEKNAAGSTRTRAQRGLSDTDGLFTATGNCNGYIGFSGSKEEYYRSSYSYEFKRRGIFGWKPWNKEFKIVMRKIENPVPMYARKAILEVPVKGKNVGFDLIAYDWVAPVRQW